MWITAISVLALHRIVLMLDAHINFEVKKHLNSRTPAELKREGVPFLHRLMCTDIGYVSLPDKQAPAPTRVIMELEGIRAHLLGAARANKALRAKKVLGELPLRSLILHGPPGTGKTTLVKSLAVTSNVDFVEVMSHDLYRPGTELVIDQASLVMDALKLLTSTVILFDEFEPILHARKETPVRITEMLTGNMLPKLDALYKAAGENGIAYVLATNYVERLDSAAIRDGRFDRIRFIYYADAASRACRLVSELRYLLKQFETSSVVLRTPVDGLGTRLAVVIAKTARCYINRLCRAGWFVAPKIKTAPLRAFQASVKDSTGERLLSPESEDKLRPVWQYLIWNEASEELDWSLFGSAERMRSATAQHAAPEPAQSEMEIEKMVKNWDEALREGVRRNPEFDWALLIRLLSKPFMIRSGHDQRSPYTDEKYRGGEDRRVSGERRRAMYAR